MNTYFVDISEPIEESKGEIYQYVGDEVVISWKKENAVKNSNCIKCYFKIREKIASLQNKYIKQFGLMPGFKGGIHFGEVVIGEKVLNKQLLISEQALDLLNP